MGYVIAEEKRNLMRSCSEDHGPGCCNRLFWPLLNLARDCLKTLLLSGLLAKLRLI